MKTDNLKNYLINAGITVYLLATPVAVLIWFKDIYSLLPELLNQSIKNGIMFFITPVILLLSSILFIAKSEYVIVLFLLYTLISIIKAMTSQIIVIDGMISFFNFGGIIINICILLYMYKMSLEQKYKYVMNNSLKLKANFRLNNIYNEINRRKLFNLLAISTSFLSVLALGKVSLLFITNSFPVIPDTIDTVLLVVVLVMYIVAGFLYIKETKMRWVPYLLAVFITVIKTIHIFHYLQLAMVFLPLLYLSIEWKQSGEAALLPEKSSE
jgi:hypothetical protein